MRGLFSIPAVTVGLLTAVGCGTADNSKPIACLDGADAYVAALGDAPGDVRLSGEAPISDCLAENQAGGDLASVGVAMVQAVTELNAEARDDPGGAANLQLGYLLGAAQLLARVAGRRPRRTNRLLARPFVAVPVRRQVA